MRKALLIIITITIGTFCYASNVPHVSNHGFPLDVKNSTKETLINTQNVSDQVSKQIETKKVITQKKAIKKNSTNSKEVVSQPTSSTQDLKISKKEQKKEIKKTQENGEIASLFSYIFGLTGCLTAAYISWFLGLLLAIAGLVLGIVGVSKGSGNKVYGILGIILNAFVILLSLILFGVILALI